MPFERARWLAEYAAVQGLSLALAPLPVRARMGVGRALGRAVELDHVQPVVVGLDEAGRSLALLRFMGGKKVPPQIQRMRSDDLLASVFPDVAARQVCTPGYSTQVRNVPQSVKDDVYAAYGIASHEPGQYEVDHLVPLELGGSNDIANLWPEAANPRPGFHEKDQVEDYLHEQVCSGSLPLQEAQARIAHDLADKPKIEPPYDAARSFVESHPEVQGFCLARPKARPRNAG